jgi:hypothetical protein
MKLWMVVGCYGLMVGAAHAERWSAESCKHLQEMKADVYAGKLPEDVKSSMLAPILKYQSWKCGVDTKEEFSAGQSALTPRAEKPAAPRRPMLCDTTPKAYGGSTTDCF